MKEFLQSIADDIGDVFSHDIETTKTYLVPGRDDVGLTFGRNQVKKGKILETCVLFIDIRNSTRLSRRLKKDKAKLGKIYAAFIGAMAAIADRYGYVRNIIGDRVMVVFEPTNCFVDAVECAVTMFTVAYKILKKHTGVEEFNVGIGIEYGEMLVLKTGIHKKHEEQSEYKNLVWVGDAANIASKLTDLSNKEYSASTYNIRYEYVHTERYLKGYKSSGTTSFAEALLGITPKLEPEYAWKIETRNSIAVLNTEEFTKNVKWAEMKYNENKIINIEKKDTAGKAPPILISGKVFTEFKKAQPKSPFLKSFAITQLPNAPSTGSEIYGGFLLLPEIKEIKF